MGEKTNTASDSGDQNQTTDETTTNSQMSLDQSTTDSTTTSSDQGNIEVLKLKRELADAQKKLRDAESDKLKASGDFKKLWEQERQQREELENKLKKNTQAFVDAQKRAVVKDAMIKAGLRNDAMKLVEQAHIEDLAVDVDDGSFKVLGVETFVSKYKSEFPFMFSKDPGTINTGGTGTRTTTTTSSGPVKSGDVYAAEKKFGTGSQEHKAMLAKFLDQKRNQQKNP
jgi:hypothetical protein